MDSLEWSSWRSVLNRPKRPKEPGVYQLGISFASFCFPKCVYIGASVDLSDRAADHFKVMPEDEVLRFNKELYYPNNSFFHPGRRVYEQLMEVIPKKYWFICWAITHDFHKLEEELIRNMVGVVNVKYRGKDGRKRAESNALDLIMTCAEVEKQKSKDKGLKLVN